jgi:hypothetical protein
MQMHATGDEADYEGEEVPCFSSCLLLSLSLFLLQFCFQIFFSRRIFLIFKHLVRQPLAALDIHIYVNSC